MVCTPDVTKFIVVKCGQSRPSLLTDLASVHLAVSHHLSLYLKQH